MAARRRRSVMDSEANVGSDFAPRGGGKRATEEPSSSECEEPELYGDGTFETQPEAPELAGVARGAVQVAGRSMAELTSSGATPKRRREPSRMPPRVYTSGSPPKGVSSSRKQYVERGVDRARRRDEYEDDGESLDADDAGDPGFSYLAFDTTLDRRLERQGRARGLRIAAAFRGTNVDSLALNSEALLDIYLRYLVAGEGARTVGMPV